MPSPVLKFSLAQFRDYVALAKLRLVSLTLLSAAAGFYLGSPSPLNAKLFWSTLLGAALVAAGSMTFNQWMERAEDALMKRTANRPLPAGRLESRPAFLFGLLLSLAGLGVLLAFTTIQAAIVAAAILLSYVLAYTPLKKKTTFNTLVGAIPGALPPLMGWAAAQGNFSYKAWTLFAIIFFWQMPHFLAIAWFCRKEYEAAGFQMLSVGDTDGSKVGGQILVHSMVLLPVSVMPSVVGITGHLYFFAAFFMSALFMMIAAFSLNQLDKRAKNLFRISLLHLSLMLLFMTLDKI